MFREFEFATYPEKVADRMVGALSKKFSNSVVTELDVCRILTGFYSEMAVTRKGMDAVYFNYMREAAIRSGKISEQNFLELMTTLPSNGYGEFIPIDKIGSKVSELKALGVDVGLKFGHYRRLTPYQIFELAMAKRVCRHLVLVIEDGKRTKEFKNKRIELTNSQRVDMFTHSCLVNTLGMTSGDDFSNEYYRDIVKQIKPTTLFIADSWPDDVKEEYLERAKLVGAEPYVLSDIVGGLTTTKMESIIFGTI